MHRFFAEIKEEAGDVELLGENAGHIARVLRLGAGDIITVCDGMGVDYLCALTVVTPGRVAAEIRGKAPNRAEPELRLTLFQSLPKLDKLEFIIQKAVELGVYRVVPVSSRRCIAKMKSEKLPRLQKIAESAAKQSARGIIPEVAPCVSLENGAEMAAGLDFAAVAYEDEENRSLGAFLREIKAGGKPLSGGIFIGPEGGFEQGEAAVLNARGIPCVTFGRRILRTETAGIYALAVIMHELENGVG